MHMAASLKLLGGLTAASGGPVESLAGKRVGLYFAAGWCPMCTSFEPDLVAWRRDQTDVDLVYVPSDGDAAQAAARASALGAISLADPAKAADLKRRFAVWAGREKSEFGDGRRAGVPAIVVIGSDDLAELAFLDAESRGAAALEAWPGSGAW